MAVPGTWQYDAEPLADKPLRRGAAGARFIARIFLDAPLRGTSRHPQLFVLIGVHESKRFKGLLMPELPEVQTVVDDLNAEGLPGCTITRAKVYWPRSIALTSPRRFQQQVERRRIVNIYRRAKFIVFVLQDDLWMAVHLRMTGRFQLFPSRSHRSRHVHVVLSLDDDRQLRFHDTRKFGRFYLTHDPDRILGALGPEPLDPDFTSKDMAVMLSRSKRQIKPLLLDQHFIAGLGNIYVDEALWAARIHPLRTAAELKADEVKSLHRNIRKVLRQGLRNAGTTLGQGPSNFYSLSRERGRNADHLKVFRRTGQPCLRCRTPIVRILVAQRSTHVCTRCQQLSST